METRVCKLSSLGQPAGGRACKACDEEGAQLGFIRSKPGISCCLGFRAGIQALDAIFTDIPVRFPSIFTI